MTLPSEDMTLPSEDMTQPCEDMTQPCEDMTLPSEDMTLPSEDMTILSEDMTLPSEDMTLPSEDMTLPCEDMTLPCEDMTQPCEDMTLPSEDMTLPSEDMTLPSEDMTLPSEDMNLPSEDITLPSEDMTLPSLLEVTIVTGEQVPFLNRETWFVKADGLKVHLLSPNQSPAFCPVVHPSRAACSRTPRWSDFSVTRWVGLTSYFIQVMLLLPASTVERPHILAVVMSLHLALHPGGHPALLVWLGAHRNCIYTARLWDVEVNGTLSVFDRVAINGVEVRLRSADAAL
ncbi:Zonadhesin [Liparis tanakae]|uniref:Zonadhesin n=1 Tax=Liparis tanakae TaxID=230148 RepID=A0A4Z2GJV9_9TELE|nr:Zonadhesin [Liparis tanakae]